MKIIYNNILPPKGYIGINLFGLLFVRNNTNISDKLINHENIHTHQMKELGYIFFYILYIIEFIFRLIQYRNWDKAYRNISFEREAYDNDDNFSYLSYRKFFSFINYLNINK
ncbi:MAG: hypothetical protein LBV71_16130 [Prevotella sp.]|jgi:hypothetical protein|nr:hypothetical protein [Prevotella sp.]